MFFKKGLYILLVFMMIMLAGCSMRTVDEMYCLPKRSDEYLDLQSVIDSAMTNLEYCAPQSGEYRQTVQMADLDGDGIQEYLLFAKATTERPLRVLIFRYLNGTYNHSDTIEFNGSAFDMVEYVPMDEKPGMELIIGCQVSEQVLRSVSVYTFSHGMAEQLLSVNYAKFLTMDFNGNSLNELFVLKPGVVETDNGIAEIYWVENGAIQRSNEITMSRPADKLKRIITGKLLGGQSAVYVASTVDDTEIMTDVFTLSNGFLSNITFSSESSTGVHTMRNYYVYADDIDNDGIVELPSLITMRPINEPFYSDRNDLIRWYSITSEGDEVNKMHTFHNFVGGWYIQLSEDWAQRLTVRNLDNCYEFYIWDVDFQKAEKIMTIYTFTGQNRKHEGIASHRFVLLETDSVVYACALEIAAQKFEITVNSVMDSFRLIQQEWKTGET